MSRLKVDIKNEHLIGVLGPRHKGNYALIMPAVYKAIDRVQSESDGSKKRFVFIHDGVTSGSTGEVIEALNKISESMHAYGYQVGYRKLPLDIELHGKQSHYRWVDDLYDFDLALMLVFDNDEFHPVKYAIREAGDIPVSVTTIHPEKKETNESKTVLG